MQEIVTTRAKRRLPAFTATMLATATILALVLFTAYPTSVHAQYQSTDQLPKGRTNAAVAEASKPIDVEAEVVEGSKSADGSTVTVRLEWEASTTLTDEVGADSSYELTGYCYEVREFEDGIQLSGTEYCNTSDDRSVEFSVSTSLSSVELQVRFTFSVTQVDGGVRTEYGTNSDTVTVTLDG